MFEEFFELINGLYFFTGSIRGEKSCFSTPFSEKEETEYLLKYRNGDVSARDELVKHNMRLVVHIAKKYSSYPDSDELISVGAIGLIKAIDTFSPEKSARLATYAARCIENEILMVIRLNKKHSNNVSLYEPIGVDKEGNEMCFMDLISTDPDEVFDQADKQTTVEKLLYAVENELTEREKGIIKMRYGLFGQKEMTQQEVCKEYGISRSYVSRIETKALKKLKTFLEK